MGHVDRAYRAIKALRKPDIALASVPGTVRNSIADVIEEQQALLREALPFIENAEAQTKVMIALGAVHGSSEAVSD